MKLKNNKAFTLIELLAVIVILAVVALVATPIVIASVENAKKSVASSSVLGYIDSLNSGLTLNNFDNDSITNAIYTCEQIESLKAEGKIFNKTDVQGDKPSGIVYVDNNKVSSANICINGYNAVYNGNQTKVLGKCSTLYKEELLHGTDPVYSSNLIPVVIENDGTVKKANIYDLDNPWYDYGNKKWANAVILKENVKDKYYDKSYGTIIESADIESYFVWIPKYSYELFAVEPKTNTGVSSIKITFGTDNTSDDVEGECTTPMTVFSEMFYKLLPMIRYTYNNNQLISYNKDNCQVGEKMTHPAFLSMNTNGFRVGKFETTGSLNRISVLPNNQTLISQPVKNMFNVAYNYKRNNDSHMMKNTEWGAVAYLVQSFYGRCEIEGTETICDEVRINNYSANKTGYSAVTAPTCSGVGGNCNKYGNLITGPNKISDLYSTETGFLASTTGNISGIYDMSGGAFEYVAAFSLEENANIYKYVQNSNISYSEALVRYPEYFDIYMNHNPISDTKNSAYYRYYDDMILGDATGELINNSSNNWYDDQRNFVSKDKPWFTRGGLFNDGIVGGVFNFWGEHGGSNGSSSSGRGGFRLVLNH